MWIFLYRFQFGGKSATNHDKGPRVQLSKYKMPAVASQTWCGETWEGVADPVRCLKDKWTRASEAEKREGYSVIMKGFMSSIAGEGDVRFTK